MNSPTNFNSDARMMRGMEITQKNEIVEKGNGSFSVPSQTGDGHTYKVGILHNEWVCDCPDFYYRHVVCKHVYAVKFQIALNSYLQNEKPLPKVFAPDTLPCNFCGSIRVMRYGISSGKQVFKCKDCGHKFREDTLLKKAKYNPELITVTLDLYFKGISLRKISDHLKQFYDLNINFSTIYKWIEKYIGIIDSYVSTLTPELSGKWHEDEMAVKVKGEMKWLWNVMDHGTRMQLASEISKTKNEVDSMKAFLKAKELAKAIPKEIVTDKMGAHPMGIERAFIKEGKPEHTVAIRGATTPNANEWAERLHNTIRERYKTQRGWKKDNTPLKNGQMIYYNYVRPHMTLDGKTPAEVAGLDKETWSSLLRKSLNARQ